MKTIFVSSTFRDMQAERDAIRDIAAPLVNAAAHAHGDQIDFCDLRWGIDTWELDSDEGAVKVLDVCFREIDRSDPPMVVILGERYGWIPDREIIADVSRRRRLALDDLEKSVTALEIEYGAIRERRRVFVYLRRIEDGDIPELYRPESSAHRRRMEQLKERLRALPDSTVVPYSVRLEEGRPARRDIEAFARRVARDLEQALAPEWEKFDRLSPFEREQERQWSFIREKDRMFLARQRDLDACLELVRSGAGQTILCRGGVGSGKSTLLSRLARTCREEGTTVLPLIGGLTDQSSDALDILKHILYFLEEQAGQPHFRQTGTQTGDTAVKELQERLLALAARLDRERKRVLVAVDAVDQLYPDENRDKLAFAPEGLAPGVRFFLTCTDDVELPVRTAHFLLPLDERDKELVIGGICSHMGRELPQAVVRRVICGPYSDTPLYMSLVVRRLLMMDAADFEAISRSGLEADAAIAARQLAILDSCPGDLGALSVEVFREAGRRINPRLADTAVKGMAVSRYGLRTDDLAALCGQDWNLLDFRRFVHYLQEHFQVRSDGRWDFLHKCIRQGFRASLDASGEAGRIHKKLQLYLFALPEDDPIRRKEIIYHTVLSDDRNYFAGFMKKYALSDEGYAREAAAACRELCLADGGAWLIQVLGVLKDQKNYTGTLWFVCRYLTERFARTSRDLRILIPILKAAEALCKAHESEMSDKNRRIFFGRIYSDLALFSTYVRSDRDAYRYGELALERKKADLNWRQDTDDRVRLYFAYYGAIVKMKNLGDAEALRHALEVGQEGLDMMDEASWERYLSGDTMLPYIDCMGEMYLRLGDREQCLAVYEEGLRLRKEYYRRHPTADHLLEMSGGYMNVAMVEAAFGTPLHNMRAYRRALKCGQILDCVGDILAFYQQQAEADGQGLDLESITHAGRTYLQTAQIIFKQENMAGYTDEARRNAVAWLHKGLELTLCAYHAAELPFARACCHEGVKDLARFAFFRTRPEYERCRPQHLRWLEEEKLRLYENPTQRRYEEYFNLINGLGGCLCNSTFPGSLAAALELFLTYGKKGLASATDGEKQARLTPYYRAYLENMGQILRTGDPSIRRDQAEAFASACDEFFAGREGETELLPVRLSTANALAEYERRAAERGI